MYMITAWWEGRVATYYVLKVRLRFRKEEVHRYAEAGAGSEGSPE